MPPGGTFSWPVSPFNPYTADGTAPIEEGAGVLSIPVDAETATVIVEIV